MTDSSIALRDARPGETDSVFDVTVSAYEQYAAYMPPDAWQAYRLDIRENVSDFANGDHIVAERDGQIVGSVLLKKPASPQRPGIGPQTTDVPEMRLLAVAPEARGLGIGQTLTRECMRRARAQGYPSMTLHTHNMMAVALQMYERMGFIRAPELDYSPVPGQTVKGYRFAL